MSVIAFPDSTRYDFVMQFVNRTSAPLLDIRSSVGNLEIEAHNPTIVRLLQRICNNNPVIFPYIGSGVHSWIITAPTRRALEQTVVRASRFVVPTYAAFDEDAHQPLFRHFNKDQNRLQLLGSQIYPAGYYSWRAPAQHFEVILRHLDFWLHLEDIHPDLRVEQTPTYRSLYESFQTSLSGANWVEAEHCIREMQRLHFVTADNVNFLQIHLLAQQQRWSDIWQSPDFLHLARLHMPKAVREALLTAFHAQILLPLEQQGNWQNALEAFQKHRGRLGSLLTGRFGLQPAPVLHIFAYQAILDGDRDILGQLRHAADSEQTRVHLEHICSLIPEIDKITSASSETEAPSTTTVAPTLTPLQQARQALSTLDYDTAIHFAREIDLPADKVLIYTQVAYQSGDLRLAEDTLLLYEELEQEEKAHLEKRFAFLKPSLKYLAELLEYPLSFTSSETKLTDRLHNHHWLNWLTLALKQPAHPDLPPALEYLKVNGDDTLWDTEHINQLNEVLIDFMSSEHMWQYQKTVMRTLVDYFLQKSDFPRQDESYRELYGTLFISLCDLREVNQNTGFALLRLAETIVQHAPLRCEQVYNDLYKWCPDPIPVLETWILEAFDLFAEFGLQPGLLISWYRSWLETLLHLPNKRETINLLSWQSLGNWIQPGADLMQQLQEICTHTIKEEANNPIGELDSGYQIGILTLRESAAQRAKQILLERNKALDIRICVAKDLNDQAKSLAQNSDMVVVVTTCITHALTYGINPYLATEPVYPRSSGSTSIVQAIEERAKQERKQKV